MSGIHFIGARWGRGVLTSVKIDVLVPARSCAHDIAIIANLFGIPSDRRHVMSAYSCAIPLSTDKARISIPARSELPYTTAFGVLRLKPYFGNTAFFICFYIVSQVLSGMLLEGKGYVILGKYIAW